MKVDVIIPNYNGSDLIKKNLPKVILAVKKYKAKIIISDDFSNIDDYNKLLEFVESINKDLVIKIIRSNKNFGFSSTVNKGVMESDAEFVTFLNTDVIPDQNFLDVCLKDLESNPNLYGVGMMDRSIDSGREVLRGRGKASFKRGFVTHRRGEVDHDDTFWISGGSCVVRREVFVKLSGFDDVYNPFYWEDIDLSYRARKSGYQIMFEKESIVEHRHEEGSIKKYYNAEKVKTIAYRNQFIFVWKNITDLKLILLHMLWLPYHFCSAITRFDIPFFVGFLKAVVKIPTIIDHRHRQLKFYKINDTNLF